VLSQFRAVKIPVAQVNLVPNVLKDPYLNSKLLAINDPKSGLSVSLAPPPVAVKEVSMSFPPRFGEHNKEIYSSLGLDIDDLKENGVI
jgi:crotonobetainyl-CoA:carnitine CoA-transferase CaiB-like acyl-CoA transferase